MNLADDAVWKIVFDSDLRQPGGAALTGRGEIAMAVAASTPMGMTVSAVTVLLINCPMMAVSTNRPASNAQGPALPTTYMDRSAISFAAPVSTMAVESGIKAPTRITVVQLMAR